MTLFSDYNMLFIDRIYDTETFVIFFLKVQSKYTKL